MKKYLIDSHHQSLEKALELYVSYLKVADKSVVVENQTSWINCLITKGVTMNKPQIVQKALEGVTETLSVTQKFDDLTEPLVELMK